MRVILAGGGTGGHIYPAISVGQALREVDLGVELLFVGSSHGPERDLATSAGIAFEAVPSSPLSCSISFRNAAALGRLALGVVRAKRILSRFKPDVVLGTGGYAAAAAMLAQWMRRGRIVINEQNAIPGRTNLWLARFADKICLGDEAAASHFPAEKIVVTGMPIRREFASLPDRREARYALGLDVDKFTILVVGGSQGAKKINALMLDAWPRIRDDHTQVLHQVGRLNLNEARAAQPGPDYRIEAFLDMPAALAAADLVIARSGASTLAEITAAGAPSILIPYPHAHADHQRLNAERIANHGAAVVYSESDLTSEMLAELIVDLRSSPEKLHEMAVSSRACGKPDAAARVAEVILSLAASEPDS